MRRYILLGFLGLIISFYLYMGFHSKIVVEEVVLPERVMIYKEYVGEYKDISSAFKDFDQDLINLQIKDYFYFGIFYDNPTLLEDPKRSRAVIGIMVDTKYRNQAITYTVRNPVFTYKEHNELTAISVTFPYRNILSLAWIVYRIYPANKVEGGEEEFVFENYIPSSETKKYCKACGEAFKDI